MKVYWDDGTWAVIEAGDLPLTGIPRSKTNDTVADAIKSNSWDPALTTLPGPKSRKHFVKIKITDIPPGTPITTANLQAANPAIPVRKAMPITPTNYKGKIIPDYPHPCHVCGGRQLILFSSTEHEGGSCPGPQKKLRLR